MSATVSSVQTQANSLAQANGFPSGQNVSLTFLDANGAVLATQPTTTIAANTRGVRVITSIMMTGVCVPAPSSSF